MTKIICLMSHFSFKEPNSNFCGPTKNRAGDTEDACGGAGYTARILNGTHGFISPPMIWPRRSLLNVHSHIDMSKETTACTCGHAPTSHNVYPPSEAEYGPREIGLSMIPELPGPKTPRQREAGLISLRILALAPPKVRP